jgi:hypothetical protein
MWEKGLILERNMLAQPPYEFRAIQLTPRDRIDADVVHLALVELEAKLAGPATDIEYVARIDPSELRECTVHRSMLADGIDQTIGLDFSLEDARFEVVEVLMPHLPLSGGHDALGQQVGDPFRMG